MTSRTFAALLALGLAATAASAASKTYPIRHLQPTDAIMALQVRMMSRK